MSLSDSMDSLHTKFDPTDYPLSQKSDNKKVKILVNKNKGSIYYNGELIGEVDDYRIINITPSKQYIYNNNVALIERAVTDVMQKINNDSVLKDTIKEIEKRKSKWCFC